jgi:hypothetical protein
MASDPILLTGKLPKLKPEVAERVGVYLAAGDDILAEYPVEADGNVRIAIDRAEAAQVARLSLVVGPRGMTETLGGAPDLARVPIAPDEIEKAKAELRLSLEKAKLGGAVLELVRVVLRKRSGHRAGRLPRAVRRSHSQHRLLPPDEDAARDGPYRCERQLHRLLQLVPMAVLVLAVLAVLVVVLAVVVGVGHPPRARADRTGAAASPGRARPRRKPAACPQPA